MNQLQKIISLSSLFVIGIGCAIVEPTDEDGQIVDRVALQQEIDFVRQSLSESEVCVEEGAALDDLLDSDSDSLERELAIEFVDESLDMLGADALCASPVVDRLTSEVGDPVAGCEFTNTGACTKCILGVQACNYCFQGSWWCPILGCELVGSSCGGATLEEAPNE